MSPTLAPSRTGRSIVRLEHVAKTFSSGTVALADLNLDIRESEFLSLLGPSGCGKSTALRIIAGLGEPSSGRIEWPSASYDASGKVEAEVGYVFQEPTLMPWATAFGNVFLPLRLKGVSKSTARPRIMEALEMVGLEKFADAYPRELSGGMKMRVSIARALVTRPRLLLMDEPFAALDEITRQKLNDDLMKLYEQFGFTVVFVTHSVFESVYLSGRVVVMAARPGRVIDEITIDAPHPRGREFRTSTLYADYCRRVSDTLIAAIGAHEHL